MSSEAIRGFRDLKVWQKSMDLVAEIYSLLKFLPHEEIYALSGQMKRAAISIPSNIAEGYGRYATKDYVRFLSIARGSKLELETQLEICIMLKYLQRSQTQKAFVLCSEVGKMLNSIIASINQNQ